MWWFHQMEYAGQMRNVVVPPNRWNAHVLGVKPLTLNANYSFSQKRKIDSPGPQLTLSSRPSPRLLLVSLVSDGAASISKRRL